MMNLFKEALWNGYRCEVLAEDTEAKLVKVRRLGESQSAASCDGIWLRYDCVKFIEGNPNES